MKVDNAQCFINRLPEIIWGRMLDCSSYISHSAIFRNHTCSSWLILPSHIEGIIELNAINLIWEREAQPVGGTLRPVKIALLDARQASCPDTSRPGQAIDAWWKRLAPYEGCFTHPKQLASWSRSYGRFARIGLDVLRR